MINFVIRSIIATVFSIFLCLLGWHAYVERNISIFRSSLVSGTSENKIRQVAKENGGVFYGTLATSDLDTDLRPSSNEFIVWFTDQAFICVESGTSFHLYLDKNRFLVKWHEARWGDGC